MTRVPLTVIAHLEAGVAWAGPWGIALDGLLAAQLHHQAKAEHPEQHTTPMLQDTSPQDLPLPLDRCDRGPDWHWAATCAWPLDGHDLLPDLRYWSGRTDHRHLETLTATFPQRLREREGRYRARWAPLTASVCTAVQWSAVGDPDILRELLEPIWAIGKKRATGQGRVLEWTVTPSPHLDPWATAHLNPDGTLGRPTPAPCVAGRDVIDGGEGTAGIRPPYVHPSRQRTLQLPLTPAHS